MIHGLIRRMIARRCRIDMKPELQRIKIAEACGWKIIDFNRGDKLPDVIPNKTTYWDKERKYKAYPAIPDYINDLNAMHEAENILFSKPEGYERRYAMLISSVVSNCGGEPFGEYAPEDLRDVCNCIHATAAQRAEAFLRTLSLWEETE